jgi:hypothetical protein
MTDAQNRQYLDDVPTEIQDLLYEERGPEAVDRLMTQKGLGKMQAALEAARIAARMREAFPDAVPELSAGGAGDLSPRTRAGIKWLFILMFLPAGLLFTTMGMNGILRARESAGWPPTEGRITRSEVVRRTSGTGTDRTTAYHAEVSYEYLVDGAAYRGDRVAYGDYGGKRKHAQRIVSRYRKGEVVTVYYNPQNPRVCLLEPGLKAQAFIMPFVGLIALLIPGYIIWSTIAAARDKRNAGGRQL